MSQGHVNEFPQIACKWIETNPAIKLVKIYLSLGNWNLYFGTVIICKYD